jgi:hypothetical protein
MPTSVQAVAFVFTEIWSTQQLEVFICTFAPEGIPLAVLQAALTTPPFDQTPYGDQVTDLAVRLVISGHQRSPGQLLQDMGALPLLEPLPPIEVRLGALLLTLLVYVWFLFFYLVWYFAILDYFLPFVSGS